MRTCMSRKSLNRPCPWLLSLANAATKRSRSAVDSVLAFLRIRTITGTEATSVPAARTSIATSPLLELGWPNFPAAKKGTVPPLVGTVTVMVAVKAPVVPTRKTTCPPPAAVFAVISKLTEDPLVPDGLVMRIRQGEGTHRRNRASGLVLSWICTSTFIRVLLLAQYHQSSRRRWDESLH